MQHLKLKELDSCCLNCLSLLTRRFKCAFGVLVFLALFYYARKLPRPSRDSEIGFVSERGFHVESSNENIFWDLEAKLRSVHQNVDHRYDFLRDRLEKIGQQRMDLVDRLMKDLNHRHNYLFAQIELLFQFNKYKEQGLERISKSITDKINRLQNGKCHLDKVLVCSLTQECGYACLFHQLTICFVLSYYMERTLVIAKPPFQGIALAENTFLPITNSCKFNFHSLDEIKKQAFRPLNIMHQQDNGNRAFRKFEQDMKELAKYHSEPVGYFVGHLMSYALRLDPTTSFYEQIKQSEKFFDIKRPFVAVHIRMTDKHLESNFFRVNQYMDQVEKFYEQYFIKHPEKANDTERVVYLASDEAYIFSTIQKEYPKYRFIFNNSAVNVISNSYSRDSRIGFESLMFDAYFLSNADFLVCTFTSNICRLVYELMITKWNDTSRIVFSLDTPYYLLSDATFYRMAILEQKKEPFLRRGDLILRRVISGFDYDEYKLNGLVFGRKGLRKMPYHYPSYMFKNFY